MEPKHAAHDAQNNLYVAASEFVTVFACQLPRVRRRANSACQKMETQIARAQASGDRGQSA
eukprot:4197078-Lingulodinium_polyedra.AAC.1